MYMTIYLRKILWKGVDPPSRSGFSGATLTSSERPLERRIAPILKGDEVGVSINSGEGQAEILIFSLSHTGGEGRPALSKVEGVMGHRVTLIL